MKRRSIFHDWVRLVTLVAGLACYGLLVLPAAAQEAPPAANRYDGREKGRRALGDGFYEAATRYFLSYRQAVGTTEPDFADATVLLAQAQFLDGAIDEAEKTLDFHAEKSPGLGDAHYQAALQYRRAAIAGAREDSPEAIRLATPLAELKQEPVIRAKALQLMGEVYVAAKNWNDAEKVLTRLIAELPTAATVPAARLNLAKLYIGTAKYPLAADLLAALQQEEDPALRLRASLQAVLLELARDRLDAAVAAYRAIQVKRPSRPDREWWLVVSQLVRRLMVAGRLEDALKLIPQARSLAFTDEQRIALRVQEAEALIELEKLALSIEALAALKQDHPEAPATVRLEFRLAELLRQMENVDLAAAYYLAVMVNEEAPLDLRYRAGISRGWNYMDSARYEDAVQAFSEAAKFGESKAGQAEAFFLAGDAAFRNGEFTGAALFYQNIGDNYGDTPFAEQARFKQAQARAQGKLYANAATTYKQFIDGFPESSLVPQARVERGVALRNAGEFLLSLKELQAFVEDSPEHALVPRGLMEAFMAAKATDDVAAAMALLTRLISKHADATLYPQALYHRAHMHFLHGRGPAAIEDSERFLKEFPRLPMAADVLLWLGDFHEATGKAEAAEKHYLGVVTSHPELPQARVALYRAARSAFRREELERATVLLAQLREMPGGEDVPRILGEAAMLHGDVLATQGRFEAAMIQFKRAAEFVDEPRFQMSAAGRVGDMYFSLGNNAENPETGKGMLGKAAEIFAALVARESGPGDIVESAKYRLAKTHEKLGDSAAALALYLDLLYQYDLDLKAGKVRDWYYFGRSGYDAARLLVLKDEFEHAARVYERLARAHIPTAADALAKAREIRLNHGLD